LRVCATFVNIVDVKQKLYKPYGKGQKNMTSFIYRLRLVDGAGEQSTLTYDLGNFSEADAGADFLAAQNAANQIRGALVDLTDANVSSETLSSVISSDNQLPDASVLIGEEALIFVHLNAPNEAEKLHKLRIPAPTDSAVFLADGRTVDPTASLVVQYVQQVAQHSVVSDGEAVNTAAGAYGNGVSDPAGYKRTVKRSYK
jgi:hypothetical protein